MFWLWGTVAFAVTGSLASAHLYTLPHPEASSPTLNAALAAQRSPDEAGHFAMTHVMYAECRCSQRIIDHLEARRARSDIRESVVLVGRDDALAQRLNHAGYRLENVSPIELKKKYDIEAAPVLIITNGRGEIAYMGGYTERKQGLDIRDTALLEALMHGGDTRELPLLGCAVSKALQRVVDPFALKYALGEISQDD